MPSWYVWQSLAHWAYSSYDYPETEGGYNILPTILGQITFLVLFYLRQFFKVKYFTCYTCSFLKIPSPAPFPKLGAREVKSKGFSFEMLS